MYGKIYEILIRFPPSVGISHALSSPHTSLQYPIHYTKMSLKPLDFVKMSIVDVVQPLVDSAEIHNMKYVCV